MPKKKPEPPRHRAPNGQKRVPKLVRLRSDLNDYVEARATARRWGFEIAAAARGEGVFTPRVPHEDEDGRPR